MRTLLMRELAELERRLLTLSAVVEERLFSADRAVAARDRNLAQEIVKGDRDVDRAEVELEEECLKVLALHQPVAGDLRYVIMMLKINNDLERVGDLAVNIAKQARRLADSPEVAPPCDIHELITRAWTLLKDSLDAFVHLDADAARHTILADKEIDAIYKRNRRILTDAVKQRPELVESWLSYLWICRFCERIGDHAANIAEDVLYMLEGRILRHRIKKGRRTGRPRPAAAPGTDPSPEGGPPVGQGEHTPS
ncbi:MAG: phosphate signaling complex protein PhoU [Kiritimatiellaeota bacterium]|nr:phosphate signaling complex protein PhoU [Kiritimatiellota bacterium]